MKFTEFVKDYLYDNYGLLWRAIIVSLVCMLLPFYRFQMLSTSKNILCFAIAFVTYCSVDILFEWIKNCKSNRNSDNPQSESKETN